MEELRKKSTNCCRWKWQEPTSGLDVEGIGREQCGYAYDQRADGYHVVRIDSAPGGFVVIHESVGVELDSITHYRSSVFQTPEGAMQHLKEYVGKCE